MLQVLKLISKPKETPKITVHTIKLRSSVYPDNKLDINEWYKHIHSYRDDKKLRLG